MAVILNQGVTIIGSGGVATSLAHAFHDKGIQINEIYSRTLEYAQKLALAIPEAKATDSLDFSSSTSGIFIVAVKDDAIHKVVEELKLSENSCVFHTSGTTSIEVLAATRSSCGIFYPLQTFTTNRVIDFKQIPILIEGENVRTSQVAEELGQLISDHVQKVTESERQQLHVAAVFASNFTNRMLAAAKEILEHTGLDINILKPLVEQSIQNAFESDPDEALTGPAKRGDLLTINKHKRILESKPELLAIYHQITKSIASKFSRQN